jgi:hypothetical protein
VLVNAAGIARPTPSSRTRRREVMDVNLNAQMRFRDGGPAAARVPGSIINIA